MEQNQETDTHESFALIGVNRVTANPAVSLFDSEIRHREFIRLRIKHASRKRSLNHDWISAERHILELDMSLAQWGAFVSSFGQGDGVPCTLAYMDGQRVDSPPYVPRLAHSTAEVKNAADEALKEIIAAFDGVKAARIQGGKRVMDDAINTLENRLENAPKNMEFAAKSLTDHVENVITKAKGDIEGMVTNHARALGMSDEQMRELTVGSAVFES